MGHGHGIHQSYHPPPIISYLDRTAKWPLKTQLERQLGGSTLWDQGMLPVSIYYGLLFLPQPGFTGSMKKGWKWGWLHYYPK